MDPSTPLTVDGISIGRETGDAPGPQLAPGRHLVLPRRGTTFIREMPGVAQDSFGQLHIRGEHNGLQYRLNGIILPEGISVFRNMTAEYARHGRPR